MWHFRPQLYKEIYIEERNENKKSEEEERECVSVWVSSGMCNKYAAYTVPTAPSAILKHIHSN